MNARSYCMLAAAVFAVVAVLQLLRILTGWSVSVNGYAIPIFGSWIAVIVAGGLSGLGFATARRD